MGFEGRRLRCPNMQFSALISDQKQRKPRGASSAKATREAGQMKLSGS